MVIWADMEQFENVSKSTAACKLNGYLGGYRTVEQFENVSKSTVACKLNGYLGGYGAMEQFENVRKSTVACKLNGYLGGYGMVEQFENLSLLAHQHDQSSLALRALFSRTVIADLGKKQFSTSSINYAGNPVIITINQARELLKDLVGANRVYGAELDRHLPEDAGTLVLSQNDLPVRKPSDSFRQAIIPLSDAVERQKYITTNQGIRFGRILENLDTFAVLISYTHATTDDSKKFPISIVTALVDRIELTHVLSQDRDIKMTGNVTWAGTSSMEITMNLEQEDDDGWVPYLVAKFLMVARNPITKKSAPINPLQPETDEEKRLFEEGAVSKAKRQEEAHKNLLRMPPDEEERVTVHEKFLQTLDLGSRTFKVRVKPENSVWMEDTVLKNIHICFPEQRNLYNKIFGGYLMRKAYELAWANASLYCKSRPFVKVVDDIAFLRPVEIGQLLFMSSQVVYTKDSFLQVKVHAEVVHPTQGVHFTTNDFHFTFDTKLVNLPSVMPKTYAESMLYLDGKRHLES
ncbi:hypothetical protein FSP39_018538 [Pinctada imbricata]|uniref:HotDog ACOT-type domain-containing protein n=1 Tax=Pinctada imbricata TaxID=66713 RepID=A0AA89BT74_PINIB|nr:hypothetical protein FSP39_018538 [Pinctada imbricata]